MKLRSFKFFLLALTIFSWVEFTAAWTGPRDYGPEFTTNILVFDGKVYFGQVQGGVTVLDVNTGRVLKRIKDFEIEARSRAKGQIVPYKGAILIFAGGDEPMTGLLDPKSLKFTWTSEVLPRKPLELGSRMASEARVKWRRNIWRPLRIGGGNLISQNWSHETIRCRDIASGNILWERPTFGRSVGGIETEVPFLGIPISQWASKKGAAMVEIRDFESAKLLHRYRHFKKISFVKVEMAKGKMAMFAYDSTPELRQIDVVRLDGFEKITTIPRSALPQGRKVLVPFFDGDKIYLWIRWPDDKYGQNLSLEVISIDLDGQLSKLEISAEERKAWPQTPYYFPYARKVFWGYGDNVIDGDSVTATDFGRIGYIARILGTGHDFASHRPPNGDPRISVGDGTIRYQEIPSPPHHRSLIEYASGANQWSTAISSTDKGGLEQFAYSDDRLLLGSSGARLICLDKVTGKAMWIYAFPSDRDLNPIKVRGGIGRFLGIYRDRIPGKISDLPNLKKRSKSTSFYVLPDDLKLTKSGIEKFLNETRPLGAPPIIVDPDPTAPVTHIMP